MKDSGFRARLSHTFPPIILVVSCLQSDAFHLFAKIEMGWLMDEKYWRKAIRIVTDEYPEIPQGSAQWWSLVLGVYKRIQGRKPLRGLIREKIIKKSNGDYSPFVVLLSLVEPLLGAPFPISVDQLLIDLPPSPAVADFHLISPHYSHIFPHYSYPQPEEATRRNYLENPIFISLQPIEVIEFLRGNPIRFGSPNLFKEEVVGAFNALWYLSLLVALAAGNIAPRSEMGLRWLLQIASNPMYRQSLTQFFMDAWNELENRKQILSTTKWYEILGLRNRFCSFGWKRPTCGIILSPSRLQQVWCVRRPFLSMPIIPHDFNYPDLKNWFLSVLENFRPSLYCINTQDTRDWIPFIGGSIDNLERDCLALVVFSDMGIKSSVPIIKVGFETPFSFVVESIRNLYARRR